MDRLWGVGSDRFTAWGFEARFRRTGGSWSRDFGRGFGLGWFAGPRRTIVHIDTRFVSDYVYPDRIYGPNSGLANSRSRKSSAVALQLVAWYFIARQVAPGFPPCASMKLAGFPLFPFWNLQGLLSFLFGNRQETDLWANGGGSKGPTNMGSTPKPIVSIQPSRFGPTKVCRHRPVHLPDPKGAREQKIGS